MPTAIEIREAKVYLRQADGTDEGLLRRLYAEQRADELEASGMAALQREVFLQMQYRAREVSYKTHHPTALDQIIHLEDGRVVGRILAQRDDEGMCLVDIAILREHQRCGLGTTVIQALQRVCDIGGGKLRLHVLKESPAEKLYRRLGFVVTGQDAFRRQMVWAKNLPETVYDSTAKRHLC